MLEASPIFGSSGTKGTCRPTVLIWNKNLSYRRDSAGRRSLPC